MSCSYRTIILWLQDHLLTCPFKYFSGFDCPLCGFQRSIIALLKGCYFDSFSYYPATIPILVIFIYQLLNPYLPLSLPSRYRSVFSVCTVLIVAVSYLFKVARYLKYLY